MENMVKYQNDKKETYVPEDLEKTKKKHDKKYNL